MIRPAVGSDVRDVYELMCCLENTRFDYADFALIFDTQIKLTGKRHPGGERAMLVWDDKSADPAKNGVRAFLNMRLEPQLHHAARVAEVQELVVSPELRGAGIGKQLLQRAARIAREEGCVRFELVTGKSRTGAHRFYGREGLTQSHFGYTLDLV